MRLVQGDVTELRTTAVGTGFRLVLDTGTFHGLNAAERGMMGREIDAVAAPDATVLMIAWAPRREDRCRGGWAARRSKPPSPAGM